MHVLCHCVGDCWVPQECFLGCHCAVQVPRALTLCIVWQRWESCHVLGLVCVLGVTVSCVCLCCGCNVCCVSTLGSGRCYDECVISLRWGCYGECITLGCKSDTGMLGDLSVMVPCVVGMCSVSLSVCLLEAAVCVV